MQYWNSETKQVMTEDGPLNGYAERKLPDGRGYCGYWKNGFPHGQGVMCIGEHTLEGEFVSEKPRASA